MLKTFFLQKESFIKRVILSPLELISYLYGFFMSVRNLFYASGLVKKVVLSSKVISVGNLTAGGSGKTPLVIKIASALAGDGKKGAVIAKGYKGSRVKDPLIVSDNGKILASVYEASDEGILLAEKLGRIPVVVGFNKCQAAMLAEEVFNPDFIVVDDGFQHLKLSRNVDIVLIDKKNISSKNFLIPRGLFREPVKNLKRADFVIVTGCNNSEKERTKESLFKITQAEIFFANKKIAEAVNFATGESLGIKELSNGNSFVFSSIAQPEQFHKLLEESGISIYNLKVYPDHYYYLESDIKEIVKEGEKVSFSITTEKDIVKLKQAAIKNLFAARLSMEIENMDRLIKHIKLKAGV